MKRTKNINRSRFRKTFMGAAVAVALTFSLTACEKADETVKFYQNAEQCAAGGENTLEQCKAAEKQALDSAAATAPKYKSLAECQAEFGDMCQATPQAQASSGGGGESSFMPLMMGYMMGSMMNNGSNHYYGSSSPMYKNKSGSYVDNKYRSYNVTPGKTFKVTKSALKPKPQSVKKAEAPRSTAKSKTVTRSGFGSSAGRSFGG